MLSNTSLSFYDRNPARITRKPVTTLFFESDSVFVLLDSVEKGFLPYSSPSKRVPLAFGLLQHSSSGEDRTIFIASTIDSKIEWVEALQKVLSQCSLNKPPVGSRSRALKSVSVTPIKSSQSRSGTGEDLEISITSSMMDSPSTSSMI